MMTEITKPTSTPGEASSSRRSSLPNPSKSPFGLSKLLSPVSLSLRIDNPIIFLHPKPLPTFEQVQDGPSTSSGTHQDPRGGSPRHSQATGLSNEPGGESQGPPASLPPGSETSPATDEEHRLHATENRGAVLSGTLLLKISKPKELKKITISLWGQSYIGFNDRPYEHQTVIAKDIKIDLMTQLVHMRSQHPNPGSVTYNREHNTFLLDKGDYWFGWSFILPAELPPYERGQFGRTTHKVIAKVKFASGLGHGVKSMGKNLSSMLAGASGGGHELEAESYFVAICNPEGQNEEVGNNLNLDFNANDFSEHLGEYTISATSSYFTVAGLLSFKFRLNQIPQRRKIIKIYKVTCFIKQQYRLISMKDKDSKTGTPAQSLPPCQRRKVFVLDSSNTHEPEPIYAPGDISRGSDDFDQAFPSESLNSPWTSNDGTLNTRSSSPAGEGNLTSNSSHSRSRSRIRELIMTSSRDPGQGELVESSHHLHNPLNGLTHIFHSHSHRREGSSRQSPRPAERSLSHHRNRSTASSMERMSSSQRLPSRNAEEDGSSDYQPHLDGSERTSGVPSSRSIRNMGSGHHIPNNCHSTSTNNLTELIESFHADDHRETNRSRSSPQTPTSPTAPVPSLTTITRGRESNPPRSSKPTEQKKNNSSRGSRGRKSGARDRGGLGEFESERPIVTLTDDHMSWEIQHTDRLPNDDIIRPSTQPGTNTNIHISHTLTFEITYSVEDAENSRSSCEGSSKVNSGCSSSKSHSTSKNSVNHSIVPPSARKVLSIGKPVHIYSCCCMAESMTLPPYSLDDPHPDIVQNPTPQHAARMVKCVCVMPTEVLMKTENNGNLERESLEFNPQESSNLNSSSSSSSLARSNHSNHHNSSNANSSIGKRFAKSTLEFRPKLENEINENYLTNRLWRMYLSTNNHPIFNNNNGHSNSNGSLNFNCETGYFEDDGSAKHV